MERVDICNMALTWIGQETITSVDDDSQRAILCKLNYAPARDATLEAHDWTFAVQRFQPAKNIVPPVYGAGQAFDIPPQILRVIACDQDETVLDPYSTVSINSREQIDWQMEGRQIICNLDVIYCRGIRRIEDEGSFSPLFVLALSAKLAVLLALALSSSTDVRQLVQMQYDEAISEAKSRDGLQGRGKRLRNRTMYKSR
jgi:hypothetical protein